MSDDYVRVRGRIKEIRPASVLFAVGAGVERAAWLPRSLIHGADDIALNGKFAGEEMTLRVVEWKADECGFTAPRDDNAAARDLFGDEDG